MGKKIAIVGICGTTNSGKTTAVEKLQKHFPSATVMCQDTYFLEPGDDRLEIVPELNHANWDKLSAMDMDRMMREVHNWIEEQSCKSDNSSAILIIEGILIFNHRPLASLFDKKYFITIDKETCEGRRNERVYNPPDPPFYFEKIVWPMYLKNLEDLKDQTDICYLSGSEDQDVIVQKIKEDIDSLQM